MTEEKFKIFNTYLNTLGYKITLRETQAANSATDNYKLERL